MIVGDTDMTIDRHILLLHSFVTRCTVFENVTNAIGAIFIDTASIKLKVKGVFMRAA